MNYKNIAVCVGALALTACAGTPKVVTPQYQAEISQAELSKVYDFEPEGVMGLHDIMGHVLMRNQDIATKNFELEIAKGERLYANLGYLPELEASLRDTKRDRLLLTTSERLGQDPIEGVDTIPSFSAPTDVKTESISLKWDLLNIAKNYLTSKQKLNAELIAERNRERAAQNTFRDIYPAYNLSAINQAEGVRLAALSKNLKVALNNRCSGVVNMKFVDDALASNCTSALSSLNNVKDLLSKLNSAELNLHALMAVRPGVPISLEQPSFSDPGEIKMPVTELVDYAVANRPELGVEIYKERNAKIDKKKAWVDVLPSVEVGVSRNNTDNPFIVNEDWEEESFNVTWNIISKVVGAPFKARQADRKAALAMSRYRALLITVQTQTELAYEDFTTSREKWINSYQKNLIQQKVRAKNKNAFSAGAMSEMAYLKNEIDGVLSQMQVSADYGRMIDAMSMLYLSIGIQITPSIDQARTPKELAELIAAHLKKLSILS